MRNTIQQLVSVLPEKYQPIFGHSEISDDASRACEDRLVVIRETYDALQVLLNRPLRVLDLGCAQGYFSLSLAAAGANVLGIDYLPENVAVCECLASEHPDLQARFQVGRIEETIESIQPGEFDLILGLSVFHHVIHEKGILSVKKLLNIAAERVGCLLLEVALKSEPLYWGPSQPEDPRELLVDLAFIHQVSLFPTHLADIPRPMFAASNRFWILNGEAQHILSWSKESHPLAEGTHQGTRRYYRSEAKFLKLYRTDHDRGLHNLTEYRQEIEFLTSSPNDFEAPTLHYFGKNEKEAWIVIQHLRGRLLSELLIERAEINTKRVLKDVIKQACVLESAGWYHNDIRTWNILIQEGGGAILLDYGSMLHKAHDCAWPNNIYLAFLVFVYEVVTRYVEPPHPLRPVAMSPGRFPPPYDGFARRLWNVPVSQWSFSLIKSLFNEIDLGVEANFQPSESWSAAIELAMQALSLNQQHLGLKAQQAESKAQQAESKAQQAESKAQQAESKVQEALARADYNYSQLSAVITSTSWQLTKPLRWSMDNIRRFRTLHVQAKLKKISKSMMFRANWLIRDQPRLKNILKTSASRLGVTDRLRRMYWATQTGAAGFDPSLPHAPQDHRQLSPRARQIYADLQREINVHQEAQR